MPPLTADDMRNWHVLFTDDRPACDITAVYPARDDSLSGLISFKDHRHKIVAVAPEFAVSLVQRCPDSDPYPGADSCPVCAGRRLVVLDPAAVTAAELKQAVASLMRFRVDSMGEAGAEFCAYPEEPGSLDITSEPGGDQFGPYLRLRLSGYSPGPKVSDGELKAAVAAESAR